MKAALIHQHGDVEAVRVEEVSEPVLKPGEAMVEVRAAALNHLDIWVRRGGRAKLAMPHVLGSDGAGVVVEAGAGAGGEGAEGFAAGDEVVINPALFCGRCEWCLRGDQSYCQHFGILGMARAGTYAQYVAVPAACLGTKPRHLDFVQAAGLSLSHLTAWRMVVSRARLQAGETVLIHGVGGGTAIAALQIAKLLSAVAVVTSSSDEKLSQAARLGADLTINYRTENVAERVKMLTGGRGADVAIDTVGAATWETNFQALAPGGRIVHCGVTSGPSAEVNIHTLYWSQFTVMGSRLGTADDFRQMLRAAEAAKMVPVVDSTFALEDVRDATARMERGEQFGKIVLRIPE
jgi:NADPH:quinone reductase-like Zn-dependent oxidoreductase